MLECWDAMLGTSEILADLGPVAFVERTKIRRIPAHFQRIVDESEQMGFHLDPPEVSQPPHRSERMKLMGFPPSAPGSAA